MQILFRAFFVWLLVAGVWAEPAPNSIVQELVANIVRRPAVYPACLENLRNQFTAGYRAHDIFDGLNHPQQAQLALRTDQGKLHETAGPLDIAVEGRGYLVLEGGSLTRDGALRHFRNSLAVNGDLRLLAFSGQGPQPVQIPSDAVQVSITTEGVVHWVDRNGDGKVHNGPQLVLATVEHERWLRHEGWHLRATPRSGFPRYLRAGQGGAGKLLAGYLEMANVNPLEQLKTAQALRSYAGLADSQ